jgi:hypothetical protein
LSLPHHGRILSLLRDSARRLRKLHEIRETNLASSGQYFEGPYPKLRTYAPADAPQLEASARLKLSIPSASLRHPPKPHCYVQFWRWSCEVQRFPKFNNFHPVPIAKGSIVCLGHQTATARPTTYRRSCSLTTITMIGVSSRLSSASSRFRSYSGQ